jgi:hypothetical protein
MGQVVGGVGHGFILISPANVIGQAARDTLAAGQVGRRVGVYLQGGLQGLSGCVAGAVCPKGEQAAQQ